MQEPEWPSGPWARHQGVCDNPRRCPHPPLVLPDWWRSLMYRGDPTHPDVDVALVEAISRIGRYNGHPRLPEDVAAFVRACALDALPAAPQPVRATWVNFTLTVFGGYARWIDETSQPLNREHVLSARTIARYVHVHKGSLKGGTRAGYLSRLEVIAGTLLGHRPAYVPVKGELPGAPLSREQEADAWHWARTLSTAYRIRVMKAVMALGRGAGLHRREMLIARREDITLDARGVHVTITDPSNRKVRVVTVDREWEDRVAALVEDCVPGGLLLRPDQTVPSRRGVTGAMRQVSKHENPPAYLTMRRLRATWLVRQMETGAPVGVLMRASGLSTSYSLEELLRYTALPDDDTTARMLRDGYRRNNSPGDLS